MNQPLQLSLFDDSPQSKTIAEKTGTFTDNMKLPVHRWFRYSAGFSAAWTEEVIKELQPKNVLDPFVGSGTVCVVADKLNVNSYGIEAHPFVYRIAKGKLAWKANSDDFLPAIDDIKNRAESIKLTLPENIPALLTKCYTKDTLISLFKIRQAYFEIAPNLPEDIQSLTFLAICSILRLSSYVGTAQWQYVLPNKRKAKTCEPFLALDNQVALIAADMQYMQSFTKVSQANLIQDDARFLKNIPDKSIDLVLTSPPYANNYDYADATRLEMTFWGEINSWGDLHEAVRKYLVCSNSQHASKEKFELASLIENPAIKVINDELIPICRQLEEIRKTKGGNKAYHTMIAAYFLDMARVFHALRRVTTTDCNICFVIGDSAPYGVYVPVQKWLGELALAVGFKNWSFEQIRKRNIKWKNRKHNIPLQEGRLWIK
ncbi:MAG: DNA methyltransferase [Rivularia sp. (in: cyanobacteria)]